MLLIAIFKVLTSQVIAARCGEDVVTTHQGDRNEYGISCDRKRGIVQHFMTEDAHWVVIAIGIAVGLRLNSSGS